MEFKFSKDTDEGAKPTAPHGDKGRQNILLVVLLILVGGFSYIYFFTGLIKPLEVQKAVEAPVQQVVKKPLPPREGQAAKTDAAVAPEANKNIAVPAGPSQQKVAVTGAPAVKTPSAEKPEPNKSKPNTPSKPAPVPAAEKKPAVPEKNAQKQAPAKADEKKAVPPVKQQPAAAAPRTAPAKEGNHKPPATAQKKAVTKPAGKNATESGQENASGPWTVKVGDYLLEDALAGDLARVRKAGLEAVVLEGGRRKSTMNRLLLGEYANRAAAQAELDKLKRFTSDAFILNQGGKHCVYAGSYILHERAVSEKERLASAGFNLTLKRAEVAIPSKILTAGTFSDKKAAETALKKLKNLGIKATLSRQKG